jgi:HSP20 family protein
MSTVRWDPTKDMMSLRDAMNKFFEENVMKPSGFTLEIGSASIPIDMYQNQNEIVVRAAVPGARPEEVDISVSEGILTIKVDVKEEKEAKEKDYLHRENRHGTASRSITLPVEVEAEKARAIFDNGMLTLNIPRVQAVKPKRIKIDVKTGSSEL